MGSDYRDCRALDLTDCQVSGFIFPWFLEITQKTKASWETFLRLMPRVVREWLPDDQWGLEHGLKLELCSLINNLWRFNLLKNPWIGCVEFEFFMSKTACNKPQHPFIQIQLFSVPLAEMRLNRTLMERSIKLCICLGLPGCSSSKLNHRTANQPTTLRHSPTVSLSSSAHEGSSISFQDQPLKNTLVSISFLY